MSISKLKAAELKRAMEEICEASNITEIRFYRSPAPGPSVSATGEVEIYSLESTGGHSSGLSLAVADEIGLLDSRARDLLNSMRSSVSAKAGRFLSMSIIGTSPFAKEILERHAAGDPGLVVHLHQPTDKSCSIDSRESWYEANPGLGTIKEISFMESEARRVSITIADQNAFRAQELNLPSDPSTAGLVPIDEWAECVVPDPPPLEGPVFVGFDCGGSRAMSAVAAYAPTTGRLRCWACFPRIPDLAKREKVDGAPYLQMQKRRRAASIREPNVELETVAGEGRRGPGAGREDQGWSCRPIQAGRMRRCDQRRRTTFQDGVAPVGIGRAWHRRCWSISKSRARQETEINAVSIARKCNQGIDCPVGRKRKSGA